MLCAKFPLELEATETHEVGLSMASLEVQSIRSCARERELRAKEMESYDESYLSTSYVKHYTPNTEKWQRKFYMKTMATVKSYENKCAMNHSIITNKNWNDAYNKQLTTTTPMTTLTHCICTSTDAWRTCTESARTAHWFYSCDCLTLHIPWLKF